MTDDPKNRYNELIKGGKIQASSEQASVVELLQKTYEQLMGRNKNKSNWFSKKRPPVKGIYLWGDVGVGKSFLLELLLDSLPIPKLRQHYHVFMQDVQQRLFAIQGTKNPLKQIAKEYAKKYQIFFLDEFIVNDICNAMILARLLEAVFAEGICLITTSNIIPDKLYEYGFQRDQFLPAIEQIKNNMATINLNSVIDYRRTDDKKYERFLSPLNNETKAAIKQQFENLNNDKEISTNAWGICNRSIPVIASAEDSVWFDFKTLCSPPRSQLDYIAISQKAKHLFLSNIPMLKDLTADQASLFIKLIDVMYDEGIKLTTTAATTIDDLDKASDAIDTISAEAMLTFSFERTKSRLIEMCS